MKLNKLTQNLKPISLVLLLSLGCVNALALEVIDSEASVVNTTPEIYDNDSWQTPTVVEFNKLDATGNGLLMPNEASKGKAFNKKTFAQADADHDGTIGQNEYVFFKTGKQPEPTKSFLSPPVSDAMPEKTMPEAAGMKEAPLSDDAR